jgi:CheY-like chemotaxis protein
LKALVVDDSMLIRHTVCRWLEERGFVVDTATNGAEALQMLDGNNPDLIITDLQMPKMTGAELISALKSRTQTAAIPVVVLAGKQSEREVPPDQRANYTIYKDIDIETQLERAVAAVTTPSRK